MGSPGEVDRRRRREQRAVRGDQTGADRSSRDASSESGLSTGESRDMKRARQRASPRGGEAHSSGGQGAQTQILGGSVPDNKAVARPPLGGQSSVEHGWGRPAGPSRWGHGLTILEQRAGLGAGAGAGAGAGVGAGAGAGAGVGVGAGTGVGVGVAAKDGVGAGEGERSGAGVGVAVTLPAVVGEDGAGGGASAAVAGASREAMWDQLPAEWRAKLGGELGAAPKTLG